MVKGIGSAVAGIQPHLGADLISKVSAHGIIDDHIIDHDIAGVDDGHLIVDGLPFRIEGTIRGRRSRLDHRQTGLLFRIGLLAGRHLNRSAVSAHPGAIRQHAAGRRGVDHHEVARVQAGHGIGYSHRGCCGMGGQGRQAEHHPAGQAIEDLDIRQILVHRVLRRDFEKNHLILEEEPPGRQIRHRLRHLDQVRQLFRRRRRILQGAYLYRD